LIIGPNGTRILYDFGDHEDDNNIAAYLQQEVDLQPWEGIHYTIVSHRDRDHYLGFRSVIEAGYDIKVANYGSGSTKGPSEKMLTFWLTPAADETTAGPVRPIPVGLAISLGEGAEAIVLAANGNVYGLRQPIRVPNENDRSVALLIRYGDFEYMLDGDLGAGRETCTGRRTHQKDVQSLVAAAAINFNLISKEHGVDVMHVAHHGSESSTSAAYLNMIKPEVALMSVGIENTFQHPRMNVVEHVLLDGGRPDCVSAPPVRLLLQTEDGKAECDGPESDRRCTSNRGTSIGDIKLTTNGSEYEIMGTGRIHGGDNESSEGPWQLSVDELSG
jgi:beta-lactamase superfamily II metal-dependent hydrolase